MANKCIFVGNLTRDFEVRVSVQGNSTIARGAMALNNGKNKDADFINLVAFDETANMMEKYGRKGTKMYIECHVKTGSYTNKDGVKVYTTDFIIDRFEFCGSKTDGDNAEKIKTNDFTEEIKPDEFMKIPEGIDEELPFV